MDKYNNILMKKEEGRNAIKINGANSIALKINKSKK
jgi:hypothetical protein